MSKITYDVAIIGGGHNGLTTAGYLAKAGLKVIVVVRQDYVGGAAISRELHPGWTYSNCSYVCSLLRPEIFRDLELSKFGLQIIRSGDFSDYFKITFNIYDDNDPAAGAHRPFISHKYISEQLTDEITSKTGFDTDDDLNLYFSNSSGSGLTIGLIVKLFCLILVGNKSLNPWVFDDGVTGFNHYPNVFSSIFFLKECGDLFQEIYACIKSKNDDYHNYLTNDIPSALRYFLLMDLFKKDDMCIYGSNKPSIIWLPLLLVVP